MPVRIAKSEKVFVEASQSVLPKIIMSTEAEPRAKRPELRGSGPTGAAFVFELSKTREFTRGLQSHVPAPTRSDAVKKRMLLARLHCRKRALVESLQRHAKATDETRHWT